MSYIKTNVDPNRISDNTKNISMISKQLQLIQNRLDQIQHRKESTETESGDDVSKYESDNDMDEMSQISNINIEQIDIKRRKGNVLNENEFPPIGSHKMNDNQIYKNRC